MAERSPAAPSLARPTSNWVERPRSFLPIFVAGSYAWWVSVGPSLAGLSVRGHAVAFLGLFLLGLAAFLPRGIFTVACGLYGFIACSATAVLLPVEPPPVASPSFFGALSWFIYALSWGVLSARTALPPANPPPNEGKAADALSNFCAVSAIEAPLGPRQKATRIPLLVLFLAAVGGMVLLVPQGLESRPRVLALAQILGLAGALSILRRAAGWGSEMYFPSAPSSKPRIVKAWLPLLLLLGSAVGVLWWLTTLVESSGVR